MAPLSPPDYGVAVSFRCRVDGYYVTLLRRPDLPGGPWRCTCSQSSQAPKGARPNCDHVHVAFDACFAYGISPRVTDIQRLAPRAWTV